MLVETIWCNRRVGGCMATRVEFAGPWRTEGRSTSLPPRLFRVFVTASGSFLKQTVSSRGTPRANFRRVSFPFQWGPVMTAMSTPPNIVRFHADTEGGIAMQQLLLLKGLRYLARKHALNCLERKKKKILKNWYLFWKKWLNGLGNLLGAFLLKSRYFFELKHRNLFRLICKSMLRPA